MEFESVSNKELKETLTEFILPFVNANPDDAAKLFVDSHASEAHLEKEKTDFFADFGVPLPDETSARKRMKLARKYLMAKAEEIRELQTIIKTMLLIAMRGKAGQSISDIPTSTIEKIENKINRVFARKKPAAQWRGAEGTYLVFEPDSGNLDWFDIYSGNWIYCVVQSLVLLPGFDGKPERLGPGYRLLGMCPVCGIFFQRRRNTKEFCSDKCASAARMRAYRERKK